MDEDELTQREEETVERDDVTGEEAHRVGEFRELRDKLDSVLGELKGLRADLAESKAAIDSMRETYTDSIAKLIENGAVVTEDNVTVDPDDALYLNAVDGTFDVLSPMAKLDLDM